MKASQLKKTAILLIFTGVYVFLFYMAFDLAFASCGSTSGDFEIFCFASPVILPVSISLFIYHWFMSKKGNPYIRYFIAFLTAVVFLTICLCVAICIYDFFVLYWKSKYTGTEMYDNYFELRCGWDDYSLRAIPTGLLLSTGSMLGGLLQFCFIVLIKKCYTLIYKK